MARAAEQKIKLLVLYDLLCRYTDEDHALDTDEIISLLAEMKIDLLFEVFDWKMLMHK